jgi:hypothetical protein
MSSSDKRRITGKEGPKFLALANYRDGNDTLEISFSKRFAKVRTR